MRRAGREYYLILLAGGDAGYTSITEDIKKFNRVCICPRYNLSTERKEENFY
jgi:hypothetical protein